MRLPCAALLVLAACAGAERPPIPYAGPREGFDLMPKCGPAFLYEIAVTFDTVDKARTCKGGAGPNTPERWNSPRYIRVDWKDSGASATLTDGPWSAPMKSHDEGPIHCGFRFEAPLGQGGESMWASFRFDTSVHPSVVDVARGEYRHVTPDDTCGILFTMKMTPILP